MVNSKPKYTFTKEHCLNKLFMASIGLLLVSKSFSAIIAFNDRSTWEILLADETTIDFEGQINSGFAPYTGNAQNVFFSSNWAPYVVDGTYSEAGGSFSLGTGDVLFGYYSYGGITASNFSANAVGMNLRGYLENFTIFNLTLSSGEIISTTVDNPQGGFLGFISDEAITSVNVTTSSVASNYITIDNFSFGNAASVPEPSIITLIAFGLLTLPFTRKLKRRS